MKNAMKSEISPGADVASTVTPQPAVFTTAGQTAAVLPIRAVLFDLDDTLWPIIPVMMAAEQSLHAWLQQHAPAVAAAHSIDSLRARRQALMEADPRHRIDLMALRTLALTEVFEACGEDPAKIAAGMALFGAARNQVQPFEDVLPALLRLSEKFMLGTISNGAADLSAIGMADHFRVSVAAHQFGSAKPDPAIFAHACEQLGVTAAETVYVGDDLLLDVVGAQQAGMRAVWMNRFERPLPPHIRPDAVCRTLDQLETWLTRD